MAGWRADRSTGFYLVWRAVVAALIMAAMSVATVQQATACGCCACDFRGGASGVAAVAGLPGGGAACGIDPDCETCLDEGGVPAADCSACAGLPQCADQTLCAGDPQLCLPGANTRTATATSTATSTSTATATATSTATSTATATVTATATPTSTRVPNGGACMNPIDCVSGNCVNDECVDAAAAAPAASNGGLVAMIVALLGAAFIALRMRRA